jgi:imidazoleglycerol phosphate synthase glutamine amidotransferase subunit HisH
MPEAVIFDYGVGNLLSLKTALEKAGLTASIGTTAQDLAKADAIALPGVGSFTAARNPSNQNPRRHATHWDLFGTTTFF